MRHCSRLCHVSKAALRQQWHQHLCLGGGGFVGSRLDDHREVAPTSSGTAALSRRLCGPTKGPASPLAPREVHLKTFRYEVTLELISNSSATFVKCLRNYLLNPLHYDVLSLYVFL